jgi:hypothetical protein
MRPTVKEPPRNGHPEASRYWLRASGELIGWTDSRKEAIDWRNGFGPGAEVSVEDHRLHEVLVHRA